jgi:GntR family transcriptional regulator
MERRIPKYDTIAADLTAKIRSGEYAPGTALPSQRDLSAVYDVTLATLRQALQVLERDGLVSQQAGRGTFVAEPKVAYQLDSLHSLADDLRSQGHVVTTTVVGASLRAVSGEAAALEAARGLRLERIRWLAGRPAIHQVSWIREPYGSRLRGVDFTDVSLYRALAECGVVVHRATERLRPELLDDATATKLDQPAGIAVFRSDRTTYGIDGDPVVFDRATILGNAMEIRTERAATKLSMRWGAAGGGAAGGGLPVGVLPKMFHRMA